MTSRHLPGTFRDHAPPDAARGLADSVPECMYESFRAGFRDASYYSSGREWTDYEPAYRYGVAAFLRHRDKRFRDIERMLEQHWPEARSPSRLVWTEARGAVLDAWQRTREAAALARDGGDDGHGADEAAARLERRES